MYKYWFLVLLSFALFFGACTKAVSLDDVHEQKLVIEGTINQVLAANIRITQSTSPTAPNPFPAIANAEVFISDEEGNSWSLEHSGDGQYNSILENANIENTFTLSVAYDSQLHKASTKIPSSDGFQYDSLYIEVDSLFLNSSPLAIYTIKLYYSTPVNTPLYGYYQYDNTSFISDSTSPFIQQTEASVDSIIFSPIEVNAGDEITFAMTQCDPWLYDFLVATYGSNDLQALAGFSIGPPASVTNNFDNDILGYFGGIYYEEIIITIP